jgi:hypothetical protein
MGAQPVPGKGLTLYLKGAQLAVFHFFGAMQIRMGELSSFPSKGGNRRSRGHCCQK